MRIPIQVTRHAVMLIREVEEARLVLARRFLSLLSNKIRNQTVLTG
jgi:hypothetical protein